MKMDRRQLPLNALRAFEAAAISCHLGRAAEQLGVTQGAVSQQIRSLETSLGQELFVRKHKRLYLSPAGQRLLDAVSEGLDRMTQGIIQLDADSQSMAGELVLCSTPSITNNLLMSVIGRFNRTYPEVSIRLSQIVPNARVLPDEFDVCVCFGLPDDTSHLETRRLHTTRLYPVASPSLTLHRPAIEDGAELLNYPLLHDRAKGWTHWFNQFANGEVKGLEANIFYSDNYQSLMAARLGQGVALAEYYEVAADLTSGQLMLLHNKGIEMGIDSYLVLPKKDRQTLRGRVFADFIEQHLEDLASHFPPDKA
ncbi:LysR substrate-binding domain-containing protein [Oceanospirillum sediminis]|uniref:LysR family transcriptional regulator n=1 Tax=Oceanospirillum sediminis TaxID=2760088 RepID=A0A839IW63_9GAMM|nr:LysR substrate-binding domain-containing protein [Oceanospirillum sediminis]MBB1489002.1 LysR family transcriptional regulator [Oceanospirillum sediminis]